MEKKNTVLLTVIAVATLLVAVVGATFAYFTATTGGQNQGNTTDVSTKPAVGGVDLDLAAVTVNTDGNIQYPGGYVVNGVKVTATSTGDDDYDVNYTLNGTITNNTATALNYKVYQLTTQATGEMVSGCVMSQTQVGQEIRYTYGDTCVVNADVLAGTVLVADGTVAAKAAEVAGTATIALSSATNTSMELTSTKAGASTFYYVVVEYPETNAAQLAGGKITATLSSVSDAVATQPGA